MSHDFMYVDCDVPEGRTLREYTRGRPARREYEAATVEWLVAMHVADDRLVESARRRFLSAALAVVV